MTGRDQPTVIQNIPLMGGRYAGELHDGVPQGWGRLQLLDGSNYEGEWKAGKPHGRGTAHYADGGVYRGDFFEGRRHGQGLYLAVDGKQYRGTWEQGKLVKPLAETVGQVPADRLTAISGASPAIKVNGISHWYGNLQAVNGISFEVYPGEILGFLGPNGAGKSTTIKALTGQLALQEGTAQILGRDIGKDDPVLQSMIGVTFEEKNLYLEMTAMENLDFFASLFDIRDSRSMEALKRVGLAERARDRVSEYSKGMRQRLMLARAFINRPKVLFLDEPTDGLDPVTAAQIRKTIREEADRGAAVLLTTHNMFEADDLSDRVAFINDGVIVALDTAENLKLRYGKRSVRVRLREGERVREENLPLDGEGASARLGELAASPDLLTIHTEEATLEAIFIQLTGRGLEG